MRTRPAVASVGSLLFAAGLTGCAAGLPVSHSCVSWVDFPDAQSMFDDATLVVAGVADAADGAIELISGPGELHRVVVDEVYKGDLADDELWAAAPRDYCVAEPPQPSEDPIPTGERVLLFLHPASADTWTVLTPLAGVSEFPDGAPLPFDGDD